MGGGPMMGSNGVGMMASFENGSMMGGAPMRAQQSVPPQMSAAACLSAPAAGSARWAPRGEGALPASAKAARVSYGSDAGPMQRLGMKKFERDASCSVTITVQFYFV